MTDRRARRHEATRQEILEAAWALARERGLTGWSLREVAAAVGMRAPSLYVYFDSKDAIYDAMFSQGYEQLLARVDALPTGGGPTEILRRAAHSYFEFCVEDPARYQLLFLRVIPGFAPSGAAYALAEEVLDRLRAALASAGITSPESLDLWTATVTGLVTQQVSNEPGGDRWARLVDRAVDMYFASEATAPG
jgi:AcrR family transcriptional regulator